ncbi:MAG: HAMP domain-containing protein [Gammaproteobacteria bacterium]|nr:MAG: HAMP domain-containing protein [Gammaproteobacteria bacterium]
MSKGNIRWYRTIRTKVVTVVIVSCVLVLGSLSAYNTLNEQKQLSAELQKLARITSQRLSKHLIGPMWDLDKDLVDSTLEAEMLEDNIHAIVVWDEGASQIFSARERGAGGHPVESNGAITGDLIKSVNDVHNGTKSIGEVAVFVSKKQLNRQLAASTLSNLVTLIALIIVMAGVMTIVMNQIIIGPITRLAKHADDISHGDLKQNIVPESYDEIGQLAEAFHRMQTSLRVAFKRIYAKTRSS